MNDTLPAAFSLQDLGWTAFFADQVEDGESDLVAHRITGVHRSRLTALSASGPSTLILPAGWVTADYAVGDWVLAAGPDRTLVRRLDRHSILQRRIEGKAAPQLAAANVDTLLVVTSCNDDFNVARLERYLAMANEAGTVPVIVLTKSDLVDDPAAYVDQALALQRDLAVVCVNARRAEAAATLAPWCGDGRTLALAGSSGVGKSTLVNTLVGAVWHASPEDGQDSGPQKTGTIRENDAKGRHTTVSRSMHAIQGGGWIIDNPGMRNLHVSHVSDGLDTLFAEIVERAGQCRFRDCTHAHEPGCAVQAAVRAGELTEARVVRWRKLSEENRLNTPRQTGPRGNRTQQKKSW